MICWGALNGQQRRAVLPFVWGRVVHDLGCGPDFPWGPGLIRLGAAKVIGVDEAPPARPVVMPGLAYRHQRFEEFTDQVDTAWLSWPSSNGSAVGLAEIAHRARVVIYIGYNFDGRTCGTDELWAVLVTRRVLCHVPDRRNCLIVYGEPGTRELLAEERAAQDMKTIHSYTEAYD